MTTKVVYSTVIVDVSCGVCGMPFGLPQNYYKDRTQDQKTFYCPNGHGICYHGETDAQRLARQLSRAKDEAARERARADGAEASLRTTKGHVTRLRKRVLEGECPLCGQHLRDVTRHVARMHAGETPEEGV